MIKIKILRKRNDKFNENKYIYIDIDDKKNLVKGCFINIWVGNKNIYENREIINIRQNKGYYSMNELSLRIVVIILRKHVVVNYVINQEI